MSWADSLQEAAFRGVKFPVLAIDDEVEKNLVEQKYPFVDGANITDMGRGARRVAVQAFFWGDNYEIESANFLNVLALPGSGELIHPIYGSIPKMVAGRWSVHHDEESPDQCLISIEFVEDNLGFALFTDVSAIQRASAVDAATAEARAESGSVLDDLIAIAQEYDVMSVLSHLRLSMLGPIGQLSQLASTVTKSSLDPILYPSAWLGNLTALSAGISSVLNFNPADMFGSYQAAYGMLLTAFSGQTVPGQTSSYESAAMVGVGVHLQVEQVCAMADAAGFVLRSECTKPTLAPNQIETIANQVRTQVQSTIDQVQSIYDPVRAWPICEALKSMAAAVLSAANAVIAARPPVIMRTITTAAPLRYLAFLWYGDHTRALELMRLNNFANPNFLPIGMQVIAYAK